MHVKEHLMHIGGTLDASTAVAKGFYSDEVPNIINSTCLYSLVREAAGVHLPL
jgi:hypothetical protein